MATAKTATAEPKAATRLHIQDRVQILRTDAHERRGIAGKTGTVVSFANYTDADGRWQLCNVKCDVTDQVIRGVASRSLARLA